MIIILQEENEITEDKKVTISDENFDVSGWVTITVGDTSQDIHIDELHHACIALYSKYRSGLERDNDL